MHLVHVPVEAHDATLGCLGYDAAHILDALGRVVLVLTAIFTYDNRDTLGGKPKLKTPEGGL